MGRSTYSMDISFLRASCSMWHFIRGFDGAGDQKSAGYCSLWRGTLRVYRQRTDSSKGGHKPLETVDGADQSSTSPCFVLRTKGSAKRESKRMMVLLSPRFGVEDSLLLLLLHHSLAYAISRIQLRVRLCEKYWKETL